MEWRKIKLDKKALMEISKAEKAVVKPQFLRRLQCIRLKDKGWKHREVSDFLGVRIETVTVWVKAYENGGVAGLLSWGYKGKKSILTNADQEKIKARNKEKPFDTAKEAKQYIKEEFGLDFHLHWVQKLLKKNFNCHTKNQP